MSAAPTTASGPRVSYAVSRAVGSAPVRNRVRRRLRASMDSRSETLDPGLAYLVGASAGAEKLRFTDLDGTLESILGDVRSVTGHGDPS